VLHALLTICQRVKEGPTHSNSLRTETQGFDDIRTAPNTGVDVDFEMLEYFRMVAPDFEECEERWRRSALALMHFFTCGMRDLRTYQDCDLHGS
jgi:hypothetical protein